MTAPCPDLRGQVARLEQENRDLRVENAKLRDTVRRQCESLAAKQDADEAQDRADYDAAGDTAAWRARPDTAAPVPITPPFESRYPAADHAFRGGPRAAWLALDARRRLNPN